MSHFPSPTTSLLTPLPREMPVAPLLCLRDPCGPMNQAGAAGISLPGVCRPTRPKQKAKSHASVKEISHNCGHSLFQTPPPPPKLNCSFHRFLSGLCFRVHGSHCSHWFSSFHVCEPRELVPRISIESWPAWNCVSHNLVILSVTGIQCCSYIFTE